MSRRRKPEAVGSVATVHIGESGVGEVARKRVIALSARVGTGTMGPAVSTRSRRITTTARTAATVIGASSTSGTRIARVALGRGSAMRKTGAQQRHHLSHLGEESSLASSKRGVALLEGSICGVG